MLKLDLMMLETAERFQQLCFRLARSEFPKAMPLNFASWDGGRDIIHFIPFRSSEHIIWQCKFTKSLNTTTKNSILDSLTKLDIERAAHLFDVTDPIQITEGPDFSSLNQPSSKTKRKRKIKIRWILCLPIDPTGVFHDWLQEHLLARKLEGEIWGRTELLLKLEKRPDILEAFFYPVYAELRNHFETEKVELLRLELDSDCQWKQSDPKVLLFSPVANVESPDLVFDVILRNRGTLETFVDAIGVQVRDHSFKAHGLPGEGLLFPQITYKVSLRGGTPGDHEEKCDPPLVIKPGGVERFKIRLTDAGYSWNGSVRLSLRLAKRKRLDFPWFRIWT
jgi:hypothetical protein